MYRVPNCCSGRPPPRFCSRPLTPRASAICRTPFTQKVGPLCSWPAQTARASKPLVTDVGFDAVDAGDLTQARLLEPLAMLWIKLAFAKGFGVDCAFVLARRNSRKPKS